MKRLLPAVTPRKEYAELVAILQDPSRWTEAHDQFTAIRTNITLPAEKKKQDDLDSSFAFVAENAAKTAYNCSGADAPFDVGSFQWLLRCEKQFLEKQKKWANQPLQRTPDTAPATSAESDPRRR